MIQRDVQPVRSPIYYAPTANTHYCSACYGILDYIYGTWWKCRGCGKWAMFTPER